jgi:ankyrin repeat protein
MQKATSQSPHDCAEMTDAVGADGSTALMASVSNQNDREADILKLLLQHGLGTQIGARDVGGGTAFHRACGHAPSPKHFSELIRAGADPNAIDAKGTTSLMFAAQNRNSDVLWDLLQLASAGPAAPGRLLMQAVDATDDSGWTALHFACRFGRSTAVDLLVTACCNVTATTRTGKTALMLAAACPEGAEACRSLLEWSSEGLELRDSEGHTARDLAAAVGHTAARRLLEDKEAEVLRERATAAGAVASHGSSPPAYNESGLRSDLMGQARGARGTSLASPIEVQPEPQLPPISTPRPRPRPPAIQPEHGQQAALTGQQLEQDSDEDSELCKAIELSAIEEQLYLQRQQLEQVQFEQALAESQIAHDKAEAARLAELRLAEQQRQQHETEQREAAQAETERQEAAARRDNAATVRRIAEEHAADEKERQRIEAEEKQRQAEQMRSRLDNAFAKFQQRREAREASSPKGPADEQNQQNASDKLEAALAKMRKRREAKQLATGKQVNVTREALEKEARRLFNNVDTDRSGHLDADEVKELARKLKLNLSEEEAKAAMEKMDADGNGTVDFDEFFGWYVNSI